MHLTGDYISNGSDFSTSNWLTTTDMYVDKIKNDLTDDNWTGIFRALRHLNESDARDSRRQTGAPLFPTPREALLPDDPPTPPAFD